MSRSVFGSNNKVGEVWSFQTNSSSADTFSVSVDGYYTPVWDKGDGSSYVQGKTLPSFSYTDSGTTKTVSIRSKYGGLSEITVISLQNDNVVGKLDLSQFTGAGDSGVYGNGIRVDFNSELTGITFPVCDSINSVSVHECDLTGVLDLTSLTNMEGSFTAYGNANLTGITHTASTGSFSTYSVYDCDLTGNHDMSMLSGCGSTFRIENNSNLTSITHSYSSQGVNFYRARSCDLTGNHDVSMLLNMGGTFEIHSNPNLTSITHTASTSTINSYLAYFCDLTGNHDVSMLELGSTFLLFGNSNLTSVTHSYTTNNINSYQVYSCDITGNHDMTMFPNLGGSFHMGANTNLTGITHTASTRTFSAYQLYSSNIIGNHDVSMLSNLGGALTFQLNSNLTGITFPVSSSERITSCQFNNCDFNGTIDLSGFAGLGATTSALTSTNKFYTNPNLTNIIFPNADGYLKNQGNNSVNATFGAFGCSLGYVDFKPLSGATLISGSTQGIPRFEINNNSMTTAEVNHILSDFDLISTLNYSGWTATSGTTGGYIDISSNSAPDGSTGGYDGTGATVNLVAKGWTVITD